MQPVLSEERAREVLRLYGTAAPNGKRFSYRQLARRFGVHHHTIEDLVTGKTWGRLRTERPKDAASAAFRALGASTAQRKTDGLALLVNAIHYVASQSEAFTCEDVWRRIDRDAVQADKRLMGPAMKLAENEGVCSQTDEFRKSESKRYRIRVWRSLVAESAPEPKRTAKFPKGRSRQRTRRR